MSKFIITTSFGLEALVKRQLIDLGYNNMQVHDGKLVLEGKLSDLPILNINLREADRVYLEILNFKALTFEELFENISAYDWADLISSEGNFIVNARTYKSKLFALRSIQAISEKAIVSSLQKKYKIKTFPKTKERYKIEVMIEKNIVSVCLDTSGEGLHKRGYREDSVKAPLRENLAAGLVDLSFYNKDRFLFDGFCGSGTILIEAARIARNMAPGLDRDFDFVHYSFFDREVFDRAKKEALERINFDIRLNILGADISQRAISLAKNNAINAGVGEDISFISRDIGSVALKNDYGILITNPPYGQRLSRIDMDQLYRKINDKFLKLDTWSLYFISGDNRFERNFKKKVSKKRKLYNGGEKVDFYQYFGQKPKK
ncbi:MAG: class I SAM-dependent RNA methyltransferase [Peptoniphilaceae bacterium]|nr:class I SAM-dependent RNA methyltransferase [Peptoniphilaceae bacterium]MDY6019761.1 class I SAM-dependent RNA methyltransferase [Anaerococcus sp.]